MSKRVIIMRGIPGSGKSTYVRNRFPGALVCSADHYFEQSGEYKFDASKLSEAHSACLRRFVRAVAHYGSLLVVVDNTNISAAEIAPYFQLAQAYGYEVTIYTVECQPAVAAKRNVHGVPEATIERMAKSLKEAENFFPRWYAQCVERVYQSARKIK